MRVLFIANDFPSPYRSDKGTFNRQLVRALAETHQVQVISPVPWIDEAKARMRGQAAARGPDERFELYYPRYYYPPMVLHEHSGWFYWQSVRRTVERLFEVARPDLVVAYWVHPDGEVAVRAARLAGVPCTVIVGGSDVLILTKDPRRRRRVVEVLGAVDAVACVSDTLRTKVLEFGIDPRKVHVWSQGIDRRIFHPGDQAEARRRVGIDGAGKVLVWVGRVVPVKGLDVLLSAMQMIRDPDIAPRLFLVGDGPLRPSLEAKARELGLGARVTFLGSLPQEKIGDWYRAADLTVLPSHSEGLPNALRESQACSTPFVASAVGGIAEIADAASDRLVPAGDARALADAIGAALRSPRPGEAYACRSPSWEESGRALIALTRGATP